MLAGFAVAATGCASQTEAVAPVTNLELDRVVLYRNGIGYFERGGEIEGGMLTLKVRKDQINDVLKSLTVVDRSSGQALSVSMPLDPQSWANAALSTLAPGQGDLAVVLDELRGTWVTVKTEDARSLKGRILMVELMESSDDEGESVDHRITLLDGDDMIVVMVSEIASITFEDNELSLQLHRALDASAGEGMFQQVEVDVRLSGEETHQIQLSYVVAAPIWKPTYRVVLDEDGQSQALLQGWAVVDNTSGEDWDEVTMSLTSGAPIAFRYDMHTPLTVDRPDMTSSGVRRRARVSLGETTIDAEPSMDEVSTKEEKSRERMAEKKPAPSRNNLGASGSGRGGGGSMAGRDRGLADLGDDMDGFDDSSGLEGEEIAEEQGLLLDELRNSTMASARAKRVSGLTRFDLASRVTVPEGSATMLSIINESVDAEQAFLFRPGGAGPGYESNPYRVLRFKNSTPFALEPGPISVYAGGSFVGEGISELIAADTSATIPFAVEPEIVVTSQSTDTSTNARLLRIGRGYLRTESFQEHTTTWTIKAPKKEAAYKVLIRHPRYGGSSLKDRPEGTEDLPDAYLVPVIVEPGKTEVSIKLVERTPVERSVSVWDSSIPQVLDSLLAASNLDAEARKKIEPIVNKRKEIADIDAKIDNLKRQQIELDQRANETRANLDAIQKDPRAGDLRQRLTKRLEEFTRDGDKHGREIVELTSKRLEKKIELDEALDGFTFEAPPEAPKK